jgi:hypothetical protein
LLRPIFQDQIKAKIAEAINAKSMQGFLLSRLSLFKNFPNANVTLEN